jgi:methylated-DNA-protein-cysteine methyltransferase-like protein
MPIRKRAPLRDQKRVHGDLAERFEDKPFAKVYELVRKIPRGRVMTYGQIATQLGGRLSPRAVGWAMHGCPKGVPWQRVVNARGTCSTDQLPGTPYGLQRSLLEREGIKFRPTGSLDLERYQWSPGSSTKVRSDSKRRKS